MLDEQARRRLRALAEHDNDPLDEAALERVVAKVTQIGPGVVRRVRHLRVGLMAAAAAIAVGSGLAITAPPRGIAEDDGSAAKKRGCEHLPAPRVTSGRVDLGPAGRAIFEGPLEVRGDACARQLVLGDGAAVRVEAEDLRGGELRVRAGETLVRVWGTTFSVRRLERGAEVTVEEGRVEVVGPAWRRWLGPGQRVDPEGVVTALTPTTPPAEPTATTAQAERSAASSDSPPAELATAQAPTRSEPAAASAEALVLRAEALRTDGELDRAAQAYRRAGRLEGPTAEAAWLALARLEQQRGRPRAALAALRQWERHFPRGALSAEATGLGFRIARDSGRDEAARRHAEALVRRHPDAPQAAAARRWLQAQR